MSMLLHALNKSSQALVITHLDPDGDAIGSLTAVGLALKQMDIPVTLVCDDNVPRRFRYLPLAGEVQQAPDLQVSYDLLIAVDCGDVFRMGSAYADLPGPKPLIINIDHHVTNSRFGDINIIDAKATSTTEILYRLFTEWGLTVDQEIALSLLTGLVTDTLGFRTMGVTAVTLSTAADLVGAGANLNMVMERALILRGFSTLQIWRTGLNHMQFEDRLLWTSISNAEREAVGFRSNSSLGLANMFANVEEAGVGVVLMELADGSVRVGFRSRPPYDVAEVATALGGGGHKLASGCSLDGPLSQATEQVVRLCKEAMLRQAAGAKEAV